MEKRNIRKFLELIKCDKWGDMAPQQDVGKWHNEDMVRYVGKVGYLKEYL